MLKQCKGEYHGDGIKYIDDNEEYCTRCQQCYKLKKKKRNEDIAKGVLVVGGLVGLVASLRKALSKKE